MKLLCSSSTGSTVFTAYWYRYPNGIEGESMQVQHREFSDVEVAINFIVRKSETTRGIYWAGAEVRDSSDNTIYEITSDYEYINCRLSDEESGE